MKTIPLTRGQVTLVDDENFSQLIMFKWFALWAPTSKSFYAARGSNQHTIRMHRVILGAQPGECVDHRNRDTLDNRRENLRICTDAENRRNRGKQCNNTSGFKGVCWNKRCHKWQARIMIDGNLINLGCFTIPEEAAVAYNSAAIRLHGEFAYNEVRPTGKDTATSDRSDVAPTS
jgi:hypothetical protein